MASDDDAVLVGGGATGGRDANAFMMVWRGIASIDRTPRRWYSDAEGRAAKPAALTAGKPSLEEAEGSRSWRKSGADPAKARGKGRE